MGTKRIVVLSGFDMESDVGSLDYRSEYKFQRVPMKEFIIWI